MARASLPAFALFPLIIALALLLGWHGSQPPMVRGAESAGSFSLPRAEAIVADIATAPHLAGSAEHARVRDALVARLRGMGLAVELQSTVAVRQNRRFGSAISSAPVANIIAVLPGRDPLQPAVAVMAHYDAVAYAPGASDDAAGTAAVIETARVLRAGPRPLRDVVLVITDSEELGLLGAQAFFDDHPLAKRIGAVVNVEARGSRGLATMFQTSPGNAALVELWAQSAIAPSGNSLTDAVYRLLPNDTDLSVALAAGKTGINAAFIDGQFDYHSPTDTPANLDPRTLQQLGDFAVTTTRALAFAPALPARGADSAYFDIFGLTVVRYPIWAGWLLTGLAAIGLAMLPLSRLGTHWRGVAAGALSTLLATVVAGGAAHLLAMALYREGAIAMRERLAEAPQALWMFVALVLGVILLARPRVGTWVGAILLLVLVAAVAQAMMPGANWLFVWPALAAVVVAHVAARTGLDNAPARIAVMTVGGFVLAAVTQVVIAAYVGLGSMTPLLVALFIPFAVALAGPTILPWSVAKAGRGGGGVLIMAALGLAGWLAASDGFSTRHPRPGDLFHLTDADRGKGWWATTSDAAELPGGSAERIEVPASRRFRVLGVPASALPVQRPTFAIDRSSNRTRLSATMATPARLLLLSVRPTVPLADVHLNGRKVVLEAGKWTAIGWRAASPAVLVIDAKAAAGAIEVRYLTALDGLPPGAPQPSGPPTNWTPLSGSRAIMGSARFALR